MTSSTMGSTDTIDWAGWLARWDAQQQRNIPRREQRFTLMLDFVEAVIGNGNMRVLDLACGPGSVAARVLARFPQASVVALDADPVLVAIGQGTLGDGGGRLTWLRADLNSADWPAAAGTYGPFDAVLSATALHWLDPGSLTRVYRQLATLMPKGGVFLNAEHLDIGPIDGLMATTAKTLRRSLTEATAQERSGETWGEWWEAVKAEPALREELVLRQQVFHDHTDEVKLPAAFHQAALEAAGFAETAVIWRFLDDTIVGGIR